jgi:hypothetical protein
VLPGALNDVRHLDIETAPIDLHHRVPAMGPQWTALGHDRRDHEWLPGISVHSWPRDHDRGVGDHGSVTGLYTTGKVSPSSSAVERGGVN